MLDSFSAHCFHTFQELTTILGPNQTIPFGLVESAWGVSRDPEPETAGCHFL